MATAPRGYTRKEAQQARQKVATGTKTATNVLDGLTPETTVEVIRFGGAMSKVSFQATGDLAGTVEFSISGMNWFTSTAIPAANGPASFTAHNVDGVRVTRTGGTGQLFIAAI